MTDYQAGCNGELPITPPQPKFCVNCRWIGTNSSGTWQNYRCFAPQNDAGPNLVTGKIMQEQPNALSARVTMTACGVEAKWFEPAPSKQSIPSIPLITKHPVNVDNLLESLK